MNKDVKATKYAIDPIRKIPQSEAVSDGGTQKKADALRGTWIRLNETMFAFIEEAQTTIVYKDADECGCACTQFADDSMNVLCEHIIALNNLPNPPQLPIESEECRWLQEYLFSRGWYSKNRYLYPSLDAETIEPEVVAELPPVGEELDPVNEDKPLDIGVDDEPEPKMIERKCHYCGFIEVGADRDQVIAHIAEHQKTCQKNPANKKKPETAEQPQDPVVKESLTTDAKSATVEKPPMEFVCEICGNKYDTSDKALNCIDRCKEAQNQSATKALMTQDTSTAGEEWTDAQIKVMRNTVADKATPAEFAYFLNVAKYSGLNPFLREIYFFKNDKGQTTIITGRDGYLTIAKRDPRFRGIHSMEVCEKDEFEMSFEDGVMKVSKHKITNIADRGKILGAWACGRMGEQDTVTIFASMTEYDKSGNAKGGKVWKQYTSSMIRKVAESMVLKRIAGISGLVTEAEIGGTDLIQIDGDD